MVGTHTKLAVSPLYFVVCDGIRFCTVEIFTSGEQSSCLSPKSAARGATETNGMKVGSRLSAASLGGRLVGEFALSLGILWTLLILTGVLLLVLAAVDVSLAVTGAVPERQITLMYSLSVVMTTSAGILIATGLWMHHGQTRWDENKSYCARDDQVYFAKEDRWEGSASTPSENFTTKPTARLGPLLDRKKELLLAEELQVVMRQTGVKKELEGGLGGEIEGALILTNERLVFVTSNLKTDNLGLRGRYGFGPRTYSDVENLASIEADPDNIFIPLASISSVTSHKARITNPSLEVKWLGEEQGRIFVQHTSTGTSRGKDLSDWATVITRLKDGTQPLFQLPEIPGVETLEGKVMRVLGDMQSKGYSGILQEVRDTFNIQADADELDSALDSLCANGLLKVNGLFYRKASALGDDDLSH
jgi:hypothetical protein